MLANENPWENEISNMKTSDLNNIRFETLSEIAGCLMIYSLAFQHCISSEKCRATN